MEREERKEREERGRREGVGRRGGEMRRRGIIVGGMILSLLLGCNNGMAELEKEKESILSISNLRKGFLDVFATFGGMVSDVLGIKAETKKSEVVKYFSDIAETMESVKKKLQDEVSKNGNYEKVKTVVDKFIKEKLDRIVSGAQEASKGTGDTDVIGNAVHNQDAVAADIASVNALVKGIREIVGVVLNDNEGNAEATKTNNQEQKTIGKLFGQGSSNDGTEQEAAAASASIGAVSGVSVL